MADGIEDIGRRHGFSVEATHEVARALHDGNGRMAQFNHPDLGGMGQWTAGGMIMIGAMFNHSLKGRVQALCNDLSDYAASQPPMVSTVSLERKLEGTSTGTLANWWPLYLGSPSAAGLQNGMHYACFPDHRRLAVMLDGQTTVYDTGDHRVSGFSQQQGGRQTLTFSSQNGMVRLDALKTV